MMRSVILSAVLAAGIAAPAAAQEKSPYEQCLGAAKGAAATLACAKAALARQEGRLKAAEAKLAGTMSAAAKPLYAAAAEAWRKFRDAQCAWDGASVGKGENAGFAVADCKVGITEARASEIEARAEPPGDEPPKK